MDMKWCRLLLILLLLLPGFLYSQHPLFKRFEIPSSEPLVFVHQVMQDQQGKTWILTDQGLYGIQGKKTTTYTRADGLPELAAGLVLDTRGSVWVYGATGSAARVSSSGLIQPRWSASLNRQVKDQLVNAFTFDDQNNVWVSTITGGKCFKISQGIVEEVDITADINHYIFETGKNTFIWGSLPRQGSAGKLRFKSGKHQTDVNISSTGVMTRSIFQKLSGGYYIYARDHELLVMSDSALISRTFVEQSIEAVFEDREGKLWLGLLAGGVKCYPGGVLALTGAISYLGNRTIGSIAEDQEGNLWFASLGDGLYRLPAKVEMTYRAPQIFTSPESPAEQEGRPTESSPIVNYPTTITSARNSYDSLPPTVFLTGLSLAGRDTLLADQYDLTYHQDVLQFSFGATGAAGQRLQYRYRLWGHDQDWIYSDNTAAVYTNLAPGAYQFVVEAMDQRGNWSRNTASTTVNIHAPFWETWWFKLLTGGLVLAMVVGLAIIRIRRIRRNEEEKTRFHKQIADLELQALRSQMNPHFIFNTLASIQHYITEQDTERANHYLSRFAKLMRAILAHSRKRYISLRDEIQTLKLYLELEALRCGDRFRYEILIDPGVDPSEEQIPSMLLQPYIENAIWHGLLPLNRKGLLRITIRIEGEALICLIEDDGIGRSNAAALRGDRTGTHQSMGLTITSERMGMLSRREQKSFMVKIEDRDPLEVKEPGTRVEVMIPLIN